jgi:hypothetical protein
MKIDPSEKQQRILSSPVVKPVRGGNTDSDFAKVLGNTVQKTADPQTQHSTTVQTSMTPSLIMPICLAQGDSEATAAHKLLNTLEKYQNLLGDPMADLKKIAPAVDDMKSITEQAQPIVDKMPEGHPVKTLSQEVLMEMSKEIERFNAGYYVDE